jgi:hypothetical protein
MITELTVCTTLEEINLKYCTNITDLGIKSLSPSLRQIDLDYVALITDEGNLLHIELLLISQKRY